MAGALHKDMLMNMCINEGPLTWVFTIKLALTCINNYSHNEETHVLVFECDQTQLNMIAVEMDSERHSGYFIIVFKIQKKDFGHLISEFQTFSGQYTVSPNI